MSEWNAQSLADHLFRLAEERVRADRRHFGEGAEQDLRALVLKGASRLLMETKSNDLDVAVHRAGDDIIRLIEYAIEGARKIAGYDRSLLGEQSYFPARIRFCPCKPFC